MILHGDSYELLPTLDLSAYKKVALVMDPPYEIESGGSTREYFKQIHASDIASGFDYSILEMVDAKSIISFCSNKQRFSLEGYLRERYHRVQLCTWHKLNPPPHANKCFVSDTEYWLHAWKRDFHPVGGYENLATHISSKVGGKSGYKHPSVKPYQIMRKAMRPVQADLIIDPFMGTGTTGLVALEMGIDFIGIEKDKTFFDMANERLGGG